MHQVGHSTEGAIDFTIAQKGFVVVVLLPNPGGGVFYSSLFNSTCSCSCIPEFNARRVTFSKMQCLHTMFEKFGSSSVR